MARPKVDYPQILGFVLSHPTELIALMGFFTAIQTKDQKQIRSAAKTLLGIIATDVNTTDPDVKKALSDLSAALSK